jgi:PRTRC genetic system protein B
MINMENITQQFGTLYHPKKAFVVYQPEDPKGKAYIESYDMDRDGRPINAHPLTVRESTALANALNTSTELNYQYLKPAGLMPGQVLYLNPDIQRGYVIWHTPARTTGLLFQESLRIPNGKANVPAMVWKASLHELSVFAVKETGVFHPGTELYHAPFFNISASGQVCMGNVKLKIGRECRLEDFMSKWENAFYNSYFSHLFSGHSPVNGNIVQLWQSLIGTKKKFPEKVLKTNRLQIKHLIK